MFCVFQIWIRKQEHRKIQSHLYLYRFVKKEETHYLDVLVSAEILIKKHQINLYNPIILLSLMTN